MLIERQRATWQRTTRIGRAVRVKDLRPGGAAPSPTLTVRASPAAELLRLIGVLVDDSGEYDVGEPRLDGLRGELPPGVLDELRQLDGGSGISFHVLSLLGADLPEPAGVDELLARSEADPGLGWRLLLAHHAHTDGQLDIGRLEAVVTGDPSALEELRATLRAAPELPENVTALLTTSPEEHGPRLLAAIRAVQPVWDTVAAETMHAITRDVEHRQAQLDAGMSVAEIVLAATNGYELSGDPSIRRIVLLPSFWIRPWLVVGRRADAEVLTTVVAEEFLVLPPESPSPALLRLVKALADENRLTLLRRLSSGPISLTEATAELDVAKATAHHHLSILRQAGLVVIGGEGRGSRYALRQDPPTVAAQALAAYLQPHRTPNLEAPESEQR
jgi:DNA-binding transcriptional ArsR family regulator